MDNNDIIESNTNISEEATAPVLQKNNSNKTVVIILLACIAIVGLLGIGVFALIKNLKGDEGLSAEPTPTVSIADETFSYLKMENNAKNIIYSPLSINNGLSLLSAGASGDTKAEIDKVLNGVSVPKYENIDNVLSLANAVFIRDSFKDNVLSSYKTNVENNFNAEVIYDSFSSSATMNQWTKNKTLGLIDELGIVPTSETKMVLANALAIQMDWKYPINDFTYGRDFHKQDGNTVNASTMSQTFKAEDVKYYTSDDATAISLPLNSKTTVNLDFIAIMPKGSLTEFINGIDSQKVKNILGNLQSASTVKDGVELYIPRFNYEYQLQFKDDLATLGIKSAFNENTADFTNMANQPLFVSAAIHKAKIDFSEKGIKAAAVTAFGLTETATFNEEVPQPIVIHIDNPFLFLIRDRDNDAIWFTGAVYEPSLWEDEKAF